MSAAKIRLILNKCERGLGGMTLLNELHKEGITWDYGHMTSVLENMQDVEYTDDDLWMMRSE